MLNRLFASNKASKDDPPPYGLQTRSSKWFILVTVAWAIFTDIFLYGVIVPVLPFALESRAGVEVDNVQHWVAIMLAVYAAGLLVFSPIWGWFADNTKSRGMPFTLGLLALMAATALLCVGNSIGIIVAGRLLQGISAALVWSVGLAIVADTVGSKNVGEAMGWITLAMGAAIFVGPMLGGIAFAKGGYYAVFGMCFGLLGLDTALRLIMIENSVARLYRSDEEQEEDSDRSKEKTVNAGTERQPDAEEPAQKTFSTRQPTVLVLLRTPRLIAALWACLVVATLLTSFDSVLPLYVSRTFHWDSLGAGLIFLSVCVPTFLEPVIGWLSDRYGTRWLAAGGFLGAMPFYVLLRFVTYNSLEQKVLLCALLTLIGVTVSLVMAPMMAEITRIVEAVEQERPGIFGDSGAYAQGYALFNVAWAGGTLVGPIWGGYVVGEAGWGTMGWSLGLLSAVTAVPTVSYSLLIASIVVLTAVVCVCRRRDI